MRMCKLQFFPHSFLTRAAFQVSQKHIPVKRHAETFGIEAFAQVGRHISFCNKLTYSGVHALRLTWPSSFIGAASILDTVLNLANISMQQFQLTIVFIGIDNRFIDNR